MNTLRQHIDMQRLPQHIAIIMDGNGRWAQQRGMDRIMGHYQGVEAVRAVTEAATELGIRYLTLYTFSNENWNRPQPEVNALMNLLMENLEREMPTFQKNNIRVQAIGNTKRLPEKAQTRLQYCIDETAGNNGLTLVLALSYSARNEIVTAARQIAAEVVMGKLQIEQIDANALAMRLDTCHIPNPDLLIRTSGEIRISNFLLWQIAYTELYFTDTLWPDFGKDDFYQAIVDYQQRERRFGLTSEQL